MGEVKISSVNMVWQDIYGVIPNVKGKGKTASLVSDIVLRMQREQPPSLPASVMCRCLPFLPPMCRVPTIRLFKVWLAVQFIHYYLVLGTEGFHFTTPKISYCLYSKPRALCEYEVGSWDAVGFQIFSMLVERVGTVLFTFKYSLCLGDSCV